MDHQRGPGKRAVRIPRHAADRVRKRVGIPKAAVRRWVERAFDEGVPRVRVSGPARIYADRLLRQERPDRDVVFWGRFLLVVAPGGTLVTVWSLPGRIPGAAVKPGGGTHA